MVLINGYKSLSTLFPYQSRFIDISGQKLHYIDEGLENSSSTDERKIVLMLHGNPTWSYYYRNLIKELKVKFRVLAPDFIGCGLSRYNKSKSSNHDKRVIYRAQDRIEHIEEFLDKLGIGKFSMVLHDWGGPIGAGVAIRRIDNVENIVFLNTTLTEIDALPFIIRTAASPLVGQLMTQHTKSFIRLTTKLGVVKRLTNDVADGYVAPYRTVESRRAIWDFVQDIPFDSNHPTYQTLLDLGSKLPELAKKRIKIIWGLKDPCFHKEMLARVASHFPAAEVHEFTDASHLILEDKTEECCLLIKEFLSATNNIIKVIPKSVKVVNDTNSCGDSILDIDVNPLPKLMFEHAKTNANQTACVEVIRRGKNLAYSYTNWDEFSRGVKQFHRGLTNLNLSSGDKVLFLMPAGSDFLQLVYAVMSCGATPLFVDPGVGRKNLITCIKDAKPDAFITIARGQVLRMIAKEAFVNCKFQITVGSISSIISYIPFLGKKFLGQGIVKPFSFLKKFASQDIDLIPNNGNALVAFTSGATGVPKGVIYTNDSMRAFLNILHDRLAYRSGAKDMPLLPIFSVFNPAQGVTTVFPPIDAAKPISMDTEKVVNVINEQQVKSCFGSPTLWQIIADYCIQSKKQLSSLNRVLIAGTEVNDSVLNSLERVVSLENVFTPYGSTECLPVTLLSGSERRKVNLQRSHTEELGTLVGKPILECKLIVAKVTGNNFDPCNSFEIGEILVCGKHVSPKYLDRAQATKEAKLFCEDGTFWHRMGDVGYLDEEGRLYYCGRKSHVVHTTDRNYYPVPVEMIVNQHAMVKRSALVALPTPAEVGLVVEPYPQYFPKKNEDTETFIKELRELCKSSPISETITTFFFHPSLPVDGRHNAKIFRDKLSDWATGLIKSSKVHP
jgi:olefin beta-lactone synthetase